MIRLLEIHLMQRLLQRVEARGAVSRLFPERLNVLKDEQDLGELAPQDLAIQLRLSSLTIPESRDSVRAQASQETLKGSLTGLLRLYGPCLKAPSLERSLAHADLAMFTMLHTLRAMGGTGGGSAMGLNGTTEFQDNHFQVCLSWSSPQFSTVQRYTSGSRTVWDLPLTLSIEVSTMPLQATRDLSMASPLRAPAPHEPLTWSPVERLPLGWFSGLSPRTLRALASVGLQTFGHLCESGVDDQLGQLKLTNRPQQVVISLSHLGRVRLQRPTSLLERTLPASVLQLPGRAILDPTPDEAVLLEPWLSKERFALELAIFALPLLKQLKPHRSEHVRLGHLLRVA